MVGYGGGPYLVSNLMKDKRFKKRPKGTWERKSNAEIEIIKKRLRVSSFNITLPFTAGGLSLFCITYVGTEIAKSIPILVFSFILPFSFVLLAQVYYGRSFVKAPNFKVCNKCFKESHLGTKTCSCGGIYEPPDYFNFKETETDNL